MEDRVEWVRYLVVLNGEVDRQFELDILNSAFALRISGGYALFTFTIDLPGTDYAERHVRDFLTSWEADMQLQPPKGHREFRSPQVHMRSGRGTAELLAIRVQVAGPQAEANHRRQYPWQHHRYEANPLVSGLIQRYQGYRNGHELLTVAGYFCVSAIEQALGGGRAAISNQLNVSSEVRKRFGDLVSSVGTFATSRKIDKNHEARELTTTEKHWLATALRLFIDRFGKHVLGEPVERELTLNDLPEIAP